MSESIKNSFGAKWPTGSTNRTSEETSEETSSNFVPSPASNLGSNTPFTSEVKLPTELSREQQVNARGADAVVRARTLPQGVVLVPRTFDPGLMNAKALLVSEKAQLVFSTKAMTGRGSARAIELMKKEDGEEVADQDRQEALTQEFMKIKHFLGLGEGKRDGQEFQKKGMSYSINWHFIEIFDEHGDVEERVDLLDKGAIKELLEGRGLDHGGEAVEAVYNALLGVNRKVKKMTKRELGDTSTTGFIHDCTGNPNGPPLFQSESAASQHVLDGKSRKDMYNRTMRKLGLIGKDRETLTLNGKKAMREMKRVSLLQLCLIRRLKAEKERIDARLEIILDKEGDGFENKEVRELNVAQNEVIKTLQEIQGANRTAIDMTLMELHREHEIKEKVSKTNNQIKTKKRTGIELLKRKYDSSSEERKIKERIAKSGEDRFLESVEKENKSKAYTTNEKDKQAAKEVGLLVAHYQNPTDRLAMIEISQEFGNTVYREPRAEKFLLLNVRGSSDKLDFNDQSYAHLKSGRVKEALKNGYGDFNGLDSTPAAQAVTNAKKELGRLDWGIHQAGAGNIAVLDHSTYADQLPPINPPAP